MKNFRSEDPFFALGQKMIALGAGLKDNRTRISELAALAHDAGLRISFEIIAPGPDEVEV